VSQKCQQKLARLQSIVRLREGWRDTFQSLKRMHSWIMETERILAAEWGEPNEVLTTEQVAQCFDQWSGELAHLTQSGTLSPDEQRCLEHFLHVTQCQRTHLLHCYEVKGLPRTNNDMESYIRSLKTRYRRVSGRKNWNAYLVRYGRSVAYYDCLAPEQTSTLAAEKFLGRVRPEQWRQARVEARQKQSVQLKMFRFKHRRQKYLQGLEARWTHSLGCT
jgi:hypothetical protein